MSDQLINEKINLLNEINEDSSTKPYIPVSVVLQEAEDLVEWCQNDKDALVRAGLDWKLVEDIPVRTGALRVSQSKWASEYKNFQECQEEWKDTAPSAYRLRDELVHHLYHALHDNSKEYAKVQRIAEGSTHADMIQDLVDLYELGMKHSGKLEAIGIDLGLLDEARSQAFKLAELLAKVNGSNRETSPKLEIRNRAYAHLKEAVDEIRRVGQYAFWKKQKRYKGYASPYLRKRARSYGKKESRVQDEVQD